MAFDQTVPLEPPQRLGENLARDAADEVDELTMPPTLMAVPRPAASARFGWLEQLPRHYHALDLVRALIDLGDRGSRGSFRRQMAF
jgi:hypothetical protein